MPHLTLTSNGLGFSVGNTIFILVHVFFGFAFGYYIGLRQANKLNPTRKVSMNVSTILSVISVVLLAACVLAFKY